MNTTPESKDNSATVWEWLDEVARGTTPLPTPAVATRVQRLLANRVLRLVRVFLIWSFTLATLVVLAGGSFITSILLATDNHLAIITGYVYWLVTLALAALLGTLAFLFTGHLLRSATYLVGSVVFNYAYFLAQLGLSTIAHPLVLPPALLLNGAYLYIAWRFILSPRTSNRQA